jgi:vacuolar-type H+-ATPase subunit I/STV1
MVETHGAAPTSRKSRAKTPSKPNPTTSAVVLQMQEQLASLVEPLRVQLREIDREIDKRKSELNELRAARTIARNALKTFDPAPPSATRAATSARGAQLVKERDDRRKLDNTRAFLQTHADELSEGFTRDALARILRDANVQPAIGPSKLGELIPKLRDEGVLRADRIVKGGGTLYVLMNGAHDAEA